MLRGRARLSVLEPPTLVWAAVCSEAPLGGCVQAPSLGGPQGVTGQADSASRLHNGGRLKDRCFFLLPGVHLWTLGSVSPGT